MRGYWLCSWQRGIAINGNTASKTGKSGFAFKFEFQMIWPPKPELDFQLHLGPLQYVTQGFGMESDGNRGQFIGSNLVIFCYKEF